MSKPIYIQNSNSSYSVSNNITAASFRGKIILGETEFDGQNQEVFGTKNIDYQSSTFWNLCLGIFKAFNEVKNDNPKSFEIQLTSGSVWRSFIAIGEYENVWLVQFRRKWNPTADSTFMKRVAKGECKPIEDAQTDWHFSKKGIAMDRENLISFISNILEPLLMNTISDVKMRGSIGRFVDFANCETTGEFQRNIQGEVDHLLKSDNFLEFTTLKNKANKLEFVKSVIRMKNESQGIFDDYKSLTESEEISQHLGLVYGLLLVKVMKKEIEY